MRMTVQPAAVLFLIGWPRAVFQGAVRVPPDLLGIFFVIVVPAVICWMGVLSFFWGTYVTSTKVVVVSWFRGYVFLRDDITDVLSLPYDGILTAGGRSWIPGTNFRMLCFVRTSGKRNLILRGTVSLPKSSRMQAEQLVTILSL